MSEIRFKRDTAFRKQFFVPDSFSHPAKMDAQLLIWLVEHYSEVGETILDPMAGSGTMMLACGLGRNCVLVELEEKFCKMMRDNWAEVKMRPQLGSTMGDCQIIQGDARNLEGILADKIITSPPYAETEAGTMLKTGQYLENFNKKWGRNRLNRGIIERYNAKITQGQIENPSNIGNLPYGNIDKCIFSPPYEGTEARDRSKEDWWNEEREKKFSGGSAKIAKGYQIDKIITSPPYEGSVNVPESNPEGRVKRLKAIGYKKLPSPHSDLSKQWSYGQAKDNIGNLKSQSYLEAMLQVYQQCYKVLKPQGLMILVTKNFIRNKTVIRLDTDTIKLCEQAGFSYLERHYRRLPSQSFWRIIYAQKHPEVEQILNEDVLVFKRG